MTAQTVLRARWLGRVRYQDALAVQRGLWSSGRDDWLLLLEHRHVYTLGVRAKQEHVLVDPVAVGAELVRSNRGGDVTYHGPGQLVGYPILSVPMGPNASPAHVHRIEQLVIDALADVGLPGTGRLEGYPGVWVDAGGSKPRKIGAIGVRVSRGRSMHGFALNVAPDMAFFEHIVPCGIADKPVTSLAGEGIDVPMARVVEAVIGRAASLWGYGQVDRQDVAWRVTPEELAPFTRGEGPGLEAPVRMLDRRLAEAGVDPSGGVALEARKPEWLRVKARMGEEYRGLRRTLRQLDLVTVCEEAGCPNIYECWADGTATFMINGDRCTRACGFCLVDTRKPLPPDPREPERVAEAVARLGLAHAVITTVARDDLVDGGAGAFAATVAAVRERMPDTAIELLISDCKGDPASLETIFAAAPDVLNHNVETVPRLQRAVRPSASYARSLAVLARAKAAGLTTKSGLVVGMGEAFDEVMSTLADLHGVGVDIVTVGQYLRPTSHHLPVVRWWTPEEFAAVATAGEALGIPHVEASPLTRSSYHARQAAAVAAGVGVVTGEQAPSPAPVGPRTQPDGRGLVVGAAAGVEVVFVTTAREARLEGIRRRMVELGVDTLLLSLGADLPWITGYQAPPLERLTMLVVPVDAAATFVVPRLEAPGVVEQPEIFTLRPWEESEDPVAIVADLVGTADELAISDRAWARFVLALQTRLPDASWRPSSAVTGPLRAVKDDEEVKALVAASAAADRVASQLLAGDIPLVGRAERQVSQDLGRRLVEEGHQKVNFAIVGSGPNSASPHHEPGSRLIEPGDAVVCDFGGTMDGYCSDITRTVWTGEPTGEARELYAVLQDAQSRGVAAAQVGTTCSAVDEAARSVIASAGYGPAFIHRTGHGIGLEEHEDPYIVAGNGLTLVPGHAFSVEPGIYLGGRFGARIEDIVIATETGPRSLNHVSHDLTVVEA